MEGGLGDGWLNQPTSQRFDRRLCLDTLGNTRRAIEQITARTNFHYSVTFKDAKSGGRSASLESLKAITFQELVIDCVHRGRVLYGRLCANPLLLAAVHTILEDERGDGVPLFIYNAVPSTASSEEIEAQFPMGMKVAIKEPHFKWAADGRASVRVDNPANVVRVPNCQDIVGGLNAMDQATIVELLQAIRSEGNKLFGKQNWFGAVAKYSERIDEGKAFEGQGSCRSERFNDVMKLAYSNRAEALLRLRNFPGALSDAEKALELDPTLIKSLDRLARAAMGMGLHVMAKEAFMALLKECPDEILRIRALWSREVEESRTGNHGFKMSHMPEKALTRCVEYVGPVEIRQVNYAGGRRGLFVTEAIKTSADVLMSNAMVVGTARMERGDGRVTFENCTMRAQASKGLRGIIGLGDVRMVYDKFTTNFDSSGGMFGPSYNEDAIVQLVQRVRASKRSMAQVYSLVSGRNQKMEVPSMELFRPGSKWIPSNANNLEVDVNLLYEIMALNGFEVETRTDFYNSANSYIRSDGRTERCAPMRGLWILPSFINHSCAPNCRPMDLGHVKFVRATRDIDCDEELTLPYVNIFESFEARQVQAREMSFTCKCQRCSLEKRLKPKFSAISAEVDGLVSRSKDECRGGKDDSLAGGRYLVTKQLADIADRLEALIVSLGTEVTTHQQNWIRASYLDAYLAKYMVAAVCEPSASVRIETLTIMVESMLSVIPSADAETLAQLLFDEVKVQHTRKSKAHKKGRELAQEVLRRLYDDAESSGIWGRWGNENATFEYGSFSFRLSDPDYDAKRLDRVNAQ